MEIVFASWGVAAGVGVILLGAAYIRGAIRILHQDHLDAIISWYRSLTKKRKHGRETQTRLHQGARS